MTIDLLYITSSSHFIVVPPFSYAKYDDDHHHHHTTTIYISCCSLILLHFARHVMSFTMFKKSFLIKDILNHREENSNVQCLACFSPAIVEPYLFKTAADSSVSTVASIWPFIQSTNNTSSWTSGKH